MSEPEKADAGTLTLVEDASDARGYRWEYSAPLGTFVPVVPPEDDCPPPLVVEPPR